MTTYSSFPPRQRSSVLPTLVAGAAFVLAAFLVLDRTGMFQPAPEVDPRPVTARGDLMGLEQTTTDIFEKWAPSVVHITTEGYQRTIWGVQKSGGSGTGFLWDDTGTVVTNYHVIKSVDQAGSKLKIALGDELYDGTVIGSRKEEDIAIVRIVAPPRELKPLLVGSSHDLRVGQFVLAIGNPYGFDRSLSTGIISALDRNVRTENSQMTGLIQTDAAINPGNSGGPLLDSAGLLIGMNTAIYSPSGTNAGIGFAVPVDKINEIVPQILDQSRNRGQLPLDYASMFRIGRMVGLPILAVESAAQSSGLRPYRVDSEDRVAEYGDMIVGIDGTAIRSERDLKYLLRERKRGEKVTLHVVRGTNSRRILKVPVTLK